VTEAQGQFRKPDEGECPPMEAFTRVLVKTQHTEKTWCIPQSTVDCVDPLPVTVACSCEL
jgi:hypothetical protein